MLTSTTQHIKTVHVKPLVWAAWHEGDEVAQGWGATPQEAIADLMRLDAERADWEEGIKEQQEY